MKVIPNESFQLLGTSISIQKGKTYEAIEATNQPNHKEKGLVFVNEILLSKEDYEMDQSIYQEHGYENRTEYLKGLANEHGVDLEAVLLAADLLGENEDFDGLVSILKDGGLNF